MTHHPPDPWEYLHMKEVLSGSGPEHLEAGFVLPTLLAPLTLSETPLVGPDKFQFKTISHLI